MNIIEQLPQLTAALLTLIGGASAIVRAITVVTGITPTTRDDEIMSTVQVWLKKIQAVLSKLALNPPTGNP